MQVLLATTQLLTCISHVLAYGANPTTTNELNEAGLTALGPRIQKKVQYYPVATSGACSAGANLIKSALEFNFYSIFVLFILLFLFLQLIAAIGYLTKSFRIFTTDLDARGFLISSFNDLFSWMFPIIIIKIIFGLILKFLLDLLFIIPTIINVLLNNYRWILLNEDK